MTLFQLFRFALVLAAVTAARPGATLAPSQQACGPVNDSLRVSRGALPSAGTYQLIITATIGPKSGRRATGELLLWPTTPGDRSPRTGQTPSPNENLAAAPLWGAITADLREVGAPLPDMRQSDWPQPGSQDPVFPGVLVRIQNWQSDTLLQQPMLWVAAPSNVRTDLGYAVADGPGIILRVRALTDSTFRGTWGPAGRLRVGGYFCAARRLEP